MRNFTNGSDHRKAGRRRPTVNITPLERAGRVVVGAATAAAGVLLLLSAASMLAVVLEL